MLTANTQNKYIYFADTDGDSVLSTIFNLTSVEGDGAGVASLVDKRRFAG